MRKFLWVVGVGALVLAMAAPAMAMDFTFGGQTRVRYWDYGGQMFNDNSAQNPGNNPRGADVRFRAMFKASDDNGNIQGVLRERIGWLVFGVGGGIQNPNNTANPALDLNALTSGAAVNTNTSGGIYSGDRTGSSVGGGLGSRGINAETEWAYLDFQVPFGVPLRIRAGMIPWYLPKGMIIDDNVAGTQAYGTSGPVSYGVAWYRLNDASRIASSDLRTAPNGLGWASRDQATTTDNKYDVYEGKVNLAIAPWLNPGIYFDYGDNRANCSPDRSVSLTNTSPSGTGYCPNQSRVRPNWFLGFTDTGKIGIVSYDFDFIYGWAKGGIGGDFEQGSINGTLGNAYMGGSVNPATGVVNIPTNPGTPYSNATPITTRGFAIDAGIHFPVGPVTVNFVASAASGDKQNGTTHSDAYPGGYSPAWNGPGNAYEILGNGSATGFDMITQTQSSLTNLWTVGAYLNYSPVKALDLKAAWAYAGFVEKNGNCALYVPESKGMGCYGPLYWGNGFVANPAGIAIGGDSGYYATQGSGGLAGKNSLGNEFQLMATWQVYTGFKIIGVMAWLVPSAGDTASKYAMMFTYDF